MNVDTKIVASVVAGIAIFGLTIWAIKKLPSNVVTKPIKEVADAVNQ